MSFSVINEDVLELLEEIAQEHLGVSTLVRRKLDSLDFHDLSVWQIKKALETAYQCGMGDSRVVK